MAVLKIDQISFVSGSWVCNATHEGRAFYKAVWYMFTPNDSKSYGRCYYGNDRKNLLAMPAPDNLVGPVQEPINRWFFGGDDGGFSRYVCDTADASKCVFE